MSTAITGVHFVYRPSVRPIERTQALAEVALLHHQNHRVTLVGIEYADGQVEALVDERQSPPTEAFSVRLGYDPEFQEWNTLLSRQHGTASGSYVSQGHAINQVLNDLLICGGGDWIAVNRSTGEIA